MSIIAKAVGWSRFKERTPFSPLRNPGGEKGCEAFLTGFKDAMGVTINWQSHCLFEGLWADEREACHPPHWHAHARSSLHVPNCLLCACKEGNELHT